MQTAEKLQQQHLCSDQWRSQKCVMEAVEKSRNHAGEDGGQWRGRVPPRKLPTFSDSNS